MNAKPVIALIGAGAVGCVLGRLLSRAGYPLGGVARRTLEGSRAAVVRIGAGRPALPAKAAASGQVVFITTPDDAIERVCEEIAPSLARDALVIHCSGALGPEALKAASARGARAAALHPLQTFAALEDSPAPLAGTVFAFSGDASAEPLCRELVDALGGRFVRIAPEKRALYHAASCVAGNYLATLEANAELLLSRAGIERGEALAALAPLIRGALRNMERLGSAGALTGPIARGDARTIERHLAALRQSAPEAVELYLALGRRTVILAREKGTLDAEGAAEIERILEA